MTVTPLQYQTSPGEKKHTFVVRAEPSGELLAAGEVKGQYIQTPMERLSLGLTPTSQTSSGACRFTVQVSSIRDEIVEVELAARLMTAGCMRSRSSLRG